MLYPFGIVGPLEEDRYQPFVDGWWLLALRGVAVLAFGLAALVLPAATFFVLVLLFSAACLIDGILNLMLAAMCAQAKARWGLVALHGVVALGIGAIVFISPHLAAVTLVTFIAAWAIISGLLMLDLATVGLQGAARWLLLLVGVTNLLFGLFLLASPVLGVLVLTWWIGLNATVVGLALLVFAFALRADAGHDRSVMTGTIR